MNKYDKALEYEIFFNKEYGILDDFLLKSEIIFDVWWYLWFFSKYALNLNSETKIHFFEPIWAFFDKSCQILANFKKNIYFNNVWISAEDWVKTIYMEKKKWMQSSFFKNNFMLRKYEEIEVKTVNLDSYIFDKNIKKIDVLKMDIEWSEFEVLWNLKSFDRIKTIFLEYHLIDKFNNKDLQNLLDNLSKNYKNIQIFENKYSDKLGYILCNE